MKGLTPDNPEQLPEVVITANPFQLTVEMLKKVCPNAPKNVDVFVPYLNEFMFKHGIVSLNDIRAFIAQIVHESGEFRYTQEISSGKAYEGRKDLGNIYAGDGVKFKGRGLIQLTGRNNYEQCSKALGVDFVKTPELLSTPQYAVESACWFWESRGLSEIANSGKDNWFKLITKKINGGYNHLNERRNYYYKAIDYIK